MSSAYSISARLNENEVSECRRVLSGFMDLHLHLAPDTVSRVCDDLEFAEDAAKIGYRGFILKDHFTPTAGRAYDIQRLYANLAIFGGVTLNHAVGGLNPDAVEAAIKLGARQVWMPTFGSVNHYAFFGTFGLPGLVPVKEVKRRADVSKGLSIFDDEKKVKPEVEEILAMIADADIILGAGHIGLDEVYSLLDAANRLGVKKFLVTHPEFNATKWSAEDQLKLAQKGAILEHCANMNYDAKLYAANIKKVGAKYCVLSSDSGQVRKGHPALAMKKFILDLMAEGVTESEIHTMAMVNTAKLLDLN